MQTIAFIRSTSIYNDSRATKEIFSLLEAGYQVVVLGWDRDGNAKEKLKSIFENRSVILYLFPIIMPEGIGLKNIDKLVRWLSWVNKTLKQYDNLDAIHVSNLDAGLGAYMYCRKRSIPYVYDIYDYYIDSHSIPLGLNNIVEHLEILLINNSILTIICTEERREQLSKAKPNQVIVIHNSPDVPEQHIIEQKYDYSYCGSLCESRLIKEILIEYDNHKDLRFAFAGNDIYKSFVNDMSRQYSNVDFYGTIPYSDVINIENSTKVLSAIYEPSFRNHQLSAPNKFYEALALGKPLIVCRNTGIDKIVEKYNIGMVIDYDANEFYLALEYLLNNDNIREEMGNRARSLYELNYKWENMSKKLIDSYQSLNIEG